MMFQDTKIMEMMNLFPSPVARIRIDKNFKDEIWYLKKHYELSSPECICIVTYIEDQVEEFVRNILGFKGDYSIDDYQLVDDKTNVMARLFHTNLDTIIAEGIMSLEIPGNLCNLMFSRIDDDTSIPVGQCNSEFYPVSQEIPMAQNELILSVGSFGPSILNVQEGKRSMFLIFSVNLN